MPSNTTRLDLLKKDPITDGNDTFNIETMLNQNWDKIDQNVALVDPETGKVLNKDGTEAGGVTAEEFETLDQTVTTHLADGTSHGIGDKATLKTANKATIVESINELFTNVSDGKGLIATAITDIGVSADGSETFLSLASKISKIDVKKTASGTTTSGNVSNQMTTLTVNGLTFKPKIIFLRSFMSNGTTMQAITIYFPEMLSGTKFFLDDGIMMDLQIENKAYGGFSVNGAYQVTDTGFVLPVRSQSNQTKRAIDWFAIS